jgi:uncharacterized membrane protein HdeD (DUF308 family)
MNVIIDPAANGSKNMKIFGIITIIMGILAIAAPLITGLSVVFMVGLLVLLGGIARMAWAFKADSLGKGLPGFAIGVLTLLCGVVLVTDPLLASGVLTIILALYFLIDGVLEVTAALQVRPSSGWGWLLAGGVLSCLLGLMIWQQFPLSGAWAIGFLLGLKLLFIGMIMISVGPISRSSA